jgi:hypothetical protein
MGKKIVLTGVTLTDTSAPMLQTGENLLLNGSFEASIVTGVQKYQGPEVTSQSTTGATHGTKTIQVVTSGVSGQGVSLLTDTGIGTQGATYIGAADLSGSGSATCWLRFFYTDATNENMASSSPLVLTGTPQRITTPAATAASGKTINVIRLYLSVAAPATTFYVDSAKVEQGSIASPYSEPGMVP